MSGYSGQEPKMECAPSCAAQVRIIEADAVLELRRKLEEDPSPESTFGQFVLSAAQKGWRIDIPRHGTLVIDYDNIVGQMWRDQGRDESVFQALGDLTAVSLGLDLVDDGK